MVGSLERRPTLRYKACMLAALLLVAVVSGCAGINSIPPKLQAIKTVGIISAVGGQLTLTHEGLVGFETRDQTFSIEPWGIDDLIVSRASAQLSARFQVQPVTYERVAFAELEQNPQIPFMNLMRDDRIKSLIRTHVSPQGLDAYVVITKANAKYGSRGRMVAGIGVINHSAVFDSRAEAHVLYMIRVIDGHDFSDIDRKSAAPVDNVEIFRLAGPSRSVDDSFLSTANDLAQNEKLKAVIINLIEQSLPLTLEDLHLVNASRTENRPD
jgi:hypothetical protein